MDLRNHPRYPPFAGRMAVLLGYLAQAQAKNLLDAAIQVDTGSPVRSIYQPATQETPAWYACSSGGISVLMVGGCTLLTHAADAMSGYSGQFTSSLASPVNDYFKERGDAIMASCAANLMLQDEVNVLSGHSLGGCIAEYILQQRIINGQRDGTHIITFGSPRYSNVSDCRMVDGDYIGRWMLTDDPVPLLPPTLSETLSIALAFSPRELIRFGNFCHPAGGIALSPGGVLSPATLPVDAAMNGIASLAGWLLAIDGSSSSAHHISSYAARIALYVAAHPAPAPVPAQGGPQEAPAQDNRRIATRAEQRMHQQIVQLEERQNAAPVIVPPLRAFSTRRVGRSFLVLFGDTTVAVSGSRRGAHHLARAGNDFLRTLQHQPLVSPDGLNGQLQEYLQLAADPDGGFRPPLNTVAPQ